MRRGVFIVFIHDLKFLVIIICFDVNIKVQSFLLYDCVSIFKRANAIWMVILLFELSMAYSLANI